MLTQAAQDLKLGGKRPVALQQLRDPVDALVDYLKVGDDSSMLMMSTSRMGSTLPFT